MAQHNELGKQGEEAGTVLLAKITGYASEIGLLEVMSWILLPKTILILFL